MTALIAWATDLTGPYQKLMWSGVAIFGALLVGEIIARLLAFLARRISGLTSRKSAETDPAASDASAENTMIDILGAVLRVMFFAGGLAIAAHIFGVYDIRNAQSLAIAAAKGLAILVAVWFLGSWLARRVRAFGEKVERTRPGGGRTLFAFLGSLVKFGALAIGLIAALQQFGFPIASLVAVIGAAGLAIALALQDTLKAVAAGVIIAIFRPYRLGDYVRISGEFGTVVDITPFTTTLNTIDNKRITVTNDKAWGATIENFSFNSTRRIDDIVGISYDDDINKAMSIIERVVTADPRARKDPPFWIKVNALNTSSVDLRYRIWCASKDYFDFKCDILKGIKEAFEAEGVTIPYPHQVAVSPDGEKLVAVRFEDRPGAGESGSRGADEAGGGHGPAR